MHNLAANLSRFDLVRQAAATARHAAEQAGQRAEDAIRAAAAEYQRRTLILTSKYSRSPEAAQ